MLCVLVIVYRSPVLKCYYFLLVLLSSLKWLLTHFYFFLNKQVDKPKEVLAIEYKETSEVQEEPSPSPPSPEPKKVEKVEEPIAEPPDLLVIS